MKLAAGFLSLAAAVNTNSDKPNIVFIFTDDQGYSDVSWKNRQVRTPNLDKLRVSGLTIEAAYSQSRCTPSRVSLMTGKYPWMVGFQADHVIETTTPAALPLSEKLLPAFMQDAGYDTHFIGKWHLGYCDESFRPQNRGFDTTFGFMGAGIHYVNHVTSGATKYADYWNDDTFMDNNNYTTDDFANRLMDIIDERTATGDTDPFYTWLSFNVPHSPILAPTDGSANLNYFSGINNDARQEYLEALWRMDYKVGEIVQKLKDAGEYDNTIFIFQSDNGPTGAGRAYPLRGMKGGYAEGGQRVPAFISGAGIRQGILDRSSFMHISDWAPTLIDFAGLDPTTVNPDFTGMSFKDVFTTGAATPRTNMYYQMDAKPTAAVYREGNLKVVYRNTKGLFTNNHTLPSEGGCVYEGLTEEGDYSFTDIADLTGHLQLATASTGQPVVMFDLEKDPYELVNVWDANSVLGEQIIDMMLADGKVIRQTIGAIDLKATSDSSFGDTHPDNTLQTTSGWCDASTIVPELQNQNAGR